VLAWPIAIALIIGAALLFMLNWSLPTGLRSIGVGLVFAAITCGLIAWLARAVTQWSLKEAAALAASAEAVVRSAGATAVRDELAQSPFAPVAAAFAEAGARDGMRTADRQHAASLERLGADAARVLDGIAAELQSDQLTSPTSTARTSPAQAMQAHVAALRAVTAAPASPLIPINVVAELQSVLAAASARRDLPAIDLTCEVERALVIVDQDRFAELIDDLVALARAASAADQRINVHVARIFRSTVVETPVRRTGDSRLTIVPRAVDETRPAWVARTQPSAEVLSIVISDAGCAPDAVEELRAFDAFALPRAGDSQGIVLARAQRTVHAANGLIWLAGSREGGSAVHLLLPIAPSA
jgi:signal transduction histidine kinase